VHHIGSRQERTAFRVAGIAYSRGIFLPSHQRGSSGSTTNSYLPSRLLSLLSNPRKHVSFAFPGTYFVSSPAQQVLRLKSNGAPKVQFWFCLRSSLRSVSPEEDKVRSRAAKMPHLPASRSRLHPLGQGQEVQSKQYNVGHLLLLLSPSHRMTHRFFS